MKKYFLLGFLLVFLLQSSHAQDVLYRKNAYWFNGSFVYKYSSKHSFLYDASLRNTSYSVEDNFDYRNRNTAFVNYVGYKYQFTEKWSVAANIGWTYQELNNLLLYKAELEHQGKIASLDFVKSLTVEYFDLSVEDSILRKDNLRFTLSALLAKDIQLNENLRLRPIIGIQLFRRTDKGYSFEEDTERRMLDKNRMRIEVMLRTKNTDFSVFAMRETDFWTLVPTSTDGINYSSADKNFIMPTYGIAVKHTITKK
jgi:hypothetical protein